MRIAPENAAGDDHPQSTAQHKQHLLGKVLVFDLNLCRMTHQKHNIAHLLFGRLGQLILRKYYARRAILGFCYVVCFPLSFMMAFEVFPMADVVFVIFAAFGVLHQAAAFLSYNRSVLDLSFRCFDTYFLIGMAIIEVVCFIDIIGWSYAKSVLVFMSVIFQINGILGDAYPISFKATERGWKRIARVRREYDSAFSAFCKTDIPLGKNISPLESEQVYQAITSMNAKNCHELADLVNKILNPNPRWPWKMRMKWRFIVFQSLARLELVSGYLLGFMVHVVTFSSVTFGVADHVRSRSFSFLYLTWTTTDLLRAVAINSALFYIRRIYTSAFYPVQTPGITQAEVVVPLVPEWGLFFSSQQQAHYWHFKKDQDNRQEDQDIEKGDCSPSPVHSHDQPTNIDLKRKVSDDIEVSSNESAIKRAPSILQQKELPTFLISSSGNGKLWDVQETLAFRLFGKYWSRKIKKLASAGKVACILSFNAAFLIFSLWVVLGDDSLMIYATAFALISMISMTINLLNTSHMLLAHSLYSFENAFLIANMLMIAYMSASYFPNHRVHYLINIISIQIFSFGGFTLDAQIVSFRNYSQGLTFVKNNESQNPLHQDELVAAESLAEELSIRLSGFTEFYHQSLEQKGAWIQKASQSQPGFLMNQEASFSQSIVFNPSTLPMEETIGQSLHARSTWGYRLCMFRITGTTKSLVLIHGLIWSIWLFHILSLELAKDNRVDDVEIVGAIWNNLAILKSCVLNVALFLMRRSFASIRHPAHSYSMKQPLLRLQITPNFVDAIRSSISIT